MEGGGWWTGERGGSLRVCMGGKVSVFEVGIS